MFCVVHFLIYFPHPDFQYTPVARKAPKPIAEKIPILRGKLFFAKQVNFLGNTKFPSHTDIRDLKFQVGQVNPVFFIKSFEGCFDVASETEKMKSKLVSFVPRVDQDRYSCYVFEQTYAEMKSRFIKDYIEAFTSKRADNLQVVFEPGNLQSFIKEKFGRIKEHFDMPEACVLEEILASLPGTVSALFYLSGMYDSYSNLIEFAKIADRKMNMQTAETDKSASRIPKDQSLPDDSDASRRAFMAMAEEERAQENPIDNPLFLPISSKAVEKATNNPQHSCRSPDQVDSVAGREEIDLAKPKKQTRKAKSKPKSSSSDTTDNVRQYVTRSVRKRDHESSSEESNDVKRFK